MLRMMGYLRLFKLRTILVRLNILMLDLAWILDFRRFFRFFKRVLRGVLIYMTCFLSSSLNHFNIFCIFIISLMLVLNIWMVRLWFLSSWYFTLVFLNFFSFLLNMIVNNLLTWRVFLLRRINLWIIIFVSGYF